MMATIRDEYWGQGGTYLLDPDTGKRKLIERTEPAQPSELQPEDLSDGTDCKEGLHPGEG